MKQMKKYAVAVALVLGGCAAQKPADGLRIVDFPGGVRVAAKYQTCDGRDVGPMIMFTPLVDPSLSGKSVKVKVLSNDDYGVDSIQLVDGEPLLATSVEVAIKKSKFIPSISKCWIGVYSV